MTAEALELASAPVVEGRSNVVVRWISRLWILYLVAGAIWTSVLLTPAVQSVLASYPAAQHPWLTLLCWFAVPACCACLIGGALSHAGFRVAWREVVGPVGPHLLLMWTAGATISVILAASATWPWAWQRSSAPTPTVMMEWAARGHIAALAFYGVSASVIIPIVEELVFRVGLLRTLAERTGSVSLAIAVSSAIFGVLHLGNLLAISPEAVRDGVANTIFGGVLAYVVTRDDGRIRHAVVLHSARNGIEAAILIWGAVRAT